MKCAATNGLGAAPAMFPQLAKRSASSHRGSTQRSSTKLCLWCRRLRQSRAGAGRRGCANGRGCGPITRPSKRFTVHYKAFEWCIQALQKHGRVAVALRDLPAPPVWHQPSRGRWCNRATWHLHDNSRQPWLWGLRLGWWRKPRTSAYRDGTDIEERDGVIDLIEASHEPQLQQGHFNLYGANSNTQSCCQCKHHQC